MKESYFETIRLIERLHRQFLEVIKVELDRTGVVDINNIQALIMSNIGKEELTVGELTNRGYYLGSNVSYNIRKLTELGYLKQKPTRHDKRSVTVIPTDKAKRAIEAVRAGEEVLGEAYGAALEGLSDVATVGESLKRLEFVWTENLGRTGRG